MDWRIICIIVQEFMSCVALTSKKRCAKAQVMYLTCFQLASAIRVDAGGVNALPLGQDIGCAIRQSLAT